MIRKIITLMLVIAVGGMAEKGYCQSEGEDNSTAETSQKQLTIQELYSRDMRSEKVRVKHSVAQKRRVATRKGNNDIKHKRYGKSVDAYRKALRVDSTYSKAQYNRAIAHRQLGQMDTAYSYYKKCIENVTSTPALRSKAYYNIGNIFLNQALAVRDTGGYDKQSLQASIEHYKASLRLNPSNKEAQYNLSIAKQLLRPEEENGGGGGGGENDQNQQQQNQDQQNGQNQDNKQQNQDQNQQGDNEQQQEQNQPQNQEEKKQKAQAHREAEQMLNAVNNNEKQTLKKVQAQEMRKEKRKGLGGRPEKDW